MEHFESFSGLAHALGRLSISANRPVVCIQGLGFVGSVMALAVASARNAAGTPAFDVVGVDLSTRAGMAKVEAINTGKFPVQSTDPRIGEAMELAWKTGNFIATTRPEAYKLSPFNMCPYPAKLLPHLRDHPYLAWR